MSKYSPYLEFGSRRAGVKRLIQRELDTRGFSQAQVAKQLGVSCQLVSNTLNGKNHSPLVLGALREMGVPEKYLFDPRQQEAKAV